MARIILSNAQKEILLSHAGFIQQVKWAILNKASYWAGHDGTTPPGGIERWRKSKSLAKQILANPSMVENQDNVRKFLVYVKNTACVDNQLPAFDPDETINYLLTNGTDQFDVMADTWFDAQIATAP